MTFLSIRQNKLAAPKLLILLVVLPFPSLLPSPIGRNAPKAVVPGYLADARMQTFGQMGR
jgi:hypothetical protein